jgi:23S rRNA (guanosine2251-2'-O)-methyltransferase
MNKQDRYLYGVHPVMEALEAGTSIEKIFIRQGKEHERIKDIRKMAKEIGVPTQEVPDEKLDRITRQGNHQGVVAEVTPVAYQDLEQVLLALQAAEQVPLLVLLDGVTDVRNFGAIARTAECMGAHAIVVPARGSAALNGDAVRTSAGALNYLPVCRVEHTVDGVMLMQAYGVPAIACTEQVGEPLFDLDLSGPLCLVLGAEDKGISRQLLRRVDLLGTIPMTGQVGSLNVSVAAGMALMEITRQRKG